MSRPKKCEVKPSTRSRKRKLSFSSASDGSDFEDYHLQPVSVKIRRLEPSDLRPEQIAELFLEIAQKPEKCFDFAICEWLTKYEQLRVKPNFAEAALLIQSASIIYGRKVDYLEGCVLNLCANRGKETIGGDETAVEAPAAAAPVVKRGRKKIIRPNTIADSLIEREFIVKEFVPLPASKLTETIKKNKDSFGSHWEKFKVAHCRVKGNGRGPGKTVVSKNSGENAEIASTNASFGAAHILDYDQEEVIGRKSDFRCFSNIIDENTCELRADYDFTEFFDRVDRVERRDGAVQVGPRRFKLFISAEYLRKTYNIEVEPEAQTPPQSPKRIASPSNPLLEKEITEFSDLPAPHPPEGDPGEFSNLPSPAREEDSAAPLTKATSNVSMVDSAYYSDLPVPPPPEDDPGELSDLLSPAREAESDAVLTKTASNVSMVDSAYYSDLPAPPPPEGDPGKLSDLPLPAREAESDAVLTKETSNVSMLDSAYYSGVDGEVALLDPNNTLLPIDHHTSIDEGISMTSKISSPYSNCDWPADWELTDDEDDDPPLLPLGEAYCDPKNLLGIDRVYLEQEENFQLPVEFLIRPADLSLNIFRLPESKVRRKCIFALPPDEFVLKPPGMKRIAPEKPPPKVIKLFKLNDGSAVPSSAVDSDDDDEPFYGFEDPIVPAAAASEPEIRHSTPVKGATPEQLQNLLPTPERIRKPDGDPNSPLRLSRDSGVLSPDLPDEADETLQVTIQEPPPLPIIPEAHAENDSDSDIFEDALSEPTPELSKHDQALVEAAQQRQAEQVHEMQELVEKVTRWHQGLKPILKHSQERNHFDIHACGSEIIDTFQAEGERISFADVMASKQADYVARYFLSTLMLANTANLAIQVHGSGGGYTGRVTEYEDVVLTLLSRERHHEAMEDGVAYVSNVGSKKKKAKKARKGCDLNSSQDSGYDTLVF